MFDFDGLAQIPKLWAKVPDLLHENLTAHQKKNEILVILFKLTHSCTLFEILSVEHKTLRLLYE